MPAKPSTPATPAATPPARIRQRRASRSSPEFLPESPSRPWAGHAPGQGATVTPRQSRPPGLEPSWNQPLTAPQRNRYLPVAGERAAADLYPVHVSSESLPTPSRRKRLEPTPRSTATPRSWPGRSSVPGSRRGHSRAPSTCPTRWARWRRPTARRCPPTRCSCRTCSRTRRARACTSGIRSATSPPTSTPATSG